MVGVIEIHEARRRHREPRQKDVFGEANGLWSCDFTLINQVTSWVLRGKQGLQQEHSSAVSLRGLMRGAWPEEVRLAGFCRMYLEIALRSDHGPTVARLCPALAGGRDREMACPASRSRGMALCSAGCSSVRIVTVMRKVLAPTLANGLFGFVV